MLTPAVPAPVAVPPSTNDRQRAADRVLAPTYARGDHYIGVPVALPAILAVVLALVYGTNGVGGDLTAASTPGAGSTVTLVLPPAALPAALPASPKPVFAAQILGYISVQSRVPLGAGA